MRTGAFQPVPSPDDNRLQRIQDNIALAVNTLAADNDILSIPATFLATSAPIVAGKSTVVYAGAPGAVLTLPAASAQGATIAAIILVGNAATGPITIRAIGTDTINGAKTLTLAGGAIVMLTSDGVSRWFAMTGVSDLAFTALAPAVSESVAAGTGVVIPRSYLIAFGTKLVIGLGARVRIL